MENDEERCDNGVAEELVGLDSSAEGVYWLIYVGCTHILSNLAASPHRDLIWTTKQL